MQRLNGEFKRRQFSNHLAAANVSSESDFGRASVAQVGEWLAVVAKQDQLPLLCWLLWLTGMPLKRLLLARVDPSANWNESSMEPAYRTVELCGRALQTGRTRRASGDALAVPGGMD